MPEAIFREIFLDELLNALSNLSWVVWLLGKPLG
jgi:hypothetical protein